MASANDPVRKTDATKGTTSGGGGGGTTTPPPSGTPYGAREMVSAFFDGLGLASLADWAWEQYLKMGPNPDFGQLLVLIQTDPFAKPIYDSVFPGMDELRKQGRAVTEGEYLNYENTVKGWLHQYGVPDGIYDTKQALAQLMVANIDLPQVERRLQTASYLVYRAPQEVRDEFSRFYGPSTQGTMMAYYMDPDASQVVLEQKWATANAAGAAKANDLGGLTQGFFEELSKLASEDQMWAAAAKVAASRELFTNLTGEDTNQVDVQTGLKAGAGVGEAQRQVEKQQRRRKAAFAGTGGLAETETGVSGLTTAQR